METSGFFDAEFDELTQTYDLQYLAAQFAQYFALFVGNGVFGSPTNQLKVRPGEGLTVVVSPGWAFVNGYWYHNDEEMVISVPSNITTQSRVDSLVCRWDNGSRRVFSGYQVGSTEILRDGAYFDLKLAEIVVPAGSTQILESNITDTRTDENVCGFVTQLLKVQTTKDLFAQYQATFEDWFATVQDQLTDDAAYQILQQLNEKEDKFDKNTAFNKNFGNSQGTVCEGNDPRLSDSRKASDVYAWAKEETKPSYTKKEVGLENVDNTADKDKSVKHSTTTEKLYTPVAIGNASFDGSNPISLKDMGVTDIILASSEPAAVEAGTVVFVYE